MTSIQLEWHDGIVSTPTWFQRLLRDRMTSRTSAETCFLPRSRRWPRLIDNGPGPWKNAMESQGRQPVRRLRPGDDRAGRPDHRVVEIGAVRFTARGDVVDRFQQLINPGCPMPSAVQAIHGISDADLVSAPFARMCSPGFLLLGRSDSTALIAHNASFDTGFLGRELAGRPSPARSSDLRHACPSTPRFRSCASLPGDPGQSLPSLSGATAPRTGTRSSSRVSGSSSRGSFRRGRC